MGVAFSQTVEDGAPRQLPVQTLHFEGGAREYVRIEMGVRQHVFGDPRRLVIRASQVTLEVTASIERIRVE
jgi:hypothetical protein